MSKISMKEIVANTKAFRPDAEAKKVKSIKVEYDPIMMEIVARSASTGSTGDTYHQELRWPAKENNRGKKYKGHANALIRNENAPRLHCTCKDFQFTFYPTLKESGQACGKFPVVKTEGKSKRPPRAVDFCGCCGHLKALYLKEKRK